MQIWVLLLATKAVTLKGATGPYAHLVNGVYEPTEETAGGVTAYCKRGDADTWLQYHEGSNKWLIQSAAYRGIDGGYAYVLSYLHRLPDQCSGVAWEVSDGAGRAFGRCQSLTATVRTYALLPLSGFAPAFHV